jgi:hypothetical protein
MVCHQRSEFKSVQPLPLQFRQRGRQELQQRGKPAERALRGRKRSELLLPRLWQCILATAALSAAFATSPIAAGPVATTAHAVPTIPVAATACTIAAAASTFVLVAVATACPIPTIPVTATACTIAAAASTWVVVGCQQRDSGVHRGAILF